MELSSVNSLPPEIIIEILTRLPLKSVLRCRCVSNLFYTITQEHEFIKKHRRRDHSTLPLTIDEDGRLLATVREKKLRYLGDSQGLLLLKTHGNRQHHLWNPTRNEMLDLPTPSKRRRLYHNIAMCFLPTTNQCKLINVYYDQKEENAFGVGCEVFTWRPLTISCLDDVRDEEELSGFRIMSKVFYMVRFFKDGAGLGDHYVSQLICFEMGNEHVTIINIPRLFFSSDHKNRVMLLKWKKKPSIVSKVEDDLHIWLLEDYKEEKWAEKKIVISLTFLNEYPNMRTFRDIGAKGDELSIYNCRGETVRYNVQSEQVIYSPPVPSRKIAYCVRPSLARLKGMKSEEKPKDCDDLE